LDTTAVSKKNIKMVNLNKLNNAAVAFIQCGDFHGAQTTLNTALKGLRSSLKSRKHEYMLGSIGYDGSKIIKILPTACEIDQQESLLQRFGSIFPFYPSPFIVSEGDSMKDETIEIGGDCVLMTVTIMFNFALVHHSAAIVAEREGKRKSERNMLRALQLYQVSRIG
jgi:hypothetical protein